ncbi:MAG: POTRA domain-containing protein [Polyangiaceae bacterium]
MRPRFTLVIGGLLLAGCAKKKEPCTPADLSGCIVDSVSIEGNTEIDDDAIKEKIATAETGGVLENVPVLGAIDVASRSDERFDRFVLERDLARVERFYRAEGFYQARVTSGHARREPLRGDEERARDPRSSTPEGQAEDAKRARVLVEIRVDEGPRTRVSSVTVGFDQKDPEFDADFERKLTTERRGLKEGDWFTETAYEENRARLQRLLTEAGYANARVVKKAFVDVQGSRASVVYGITTGMKCKFGPIRIVGASTEVLDWILRRGLGFSKGDPFSSATLEATERWLTEFGVFGAITIEPDPTPTEAIGPTDVPILIRLERANLGALKLGVGAEIGDSVAARGVIGWQDKNLFGILDHWNLEVRPRVVFYPIRFSTLFDAPPSAVLPELTVRAQYSFPVPFEPRTTIFLQGEGGVSRPENAATPQIPDPDENILGYQRVSGKFGLQRRFLSSRFFVFPSFNVHFLNPISYNLDSVPAGYQSLTLRNIELSLDLDLRRGKGGWNSAAPRLGAFFTTDLQIGGFFLGGDGSDVRFRPEARFYIPLLRNLVLAGRFGTGLLYADDYATSLDADIPSSTIREADGDADARTKLNRDLQIVALRGLFSGGPNSNRGYGYNEIAPHRVFDEEGALLLAPQPVGGRTEWDASLEFRLSFNETVGSVFFLDASDVTRGFAEYRLTHPHLSLGAGLRYETPVGPLRVDLGYRIHGAQVIGEVDVESCIAKGEDCPTAIIDEGDPSKLLGAPLAFAIAIGNAF